MRFLVLIFFTWLSMAVGAQNSANGYNKFYYENGKISSEGRMKDGKPDGYWKNYYKNGLIKIEGNRKNFLLDSIWKFYDEKGRITKSIEYKVGKKDGSTIQYDTLGRIVMVESFKNDIKNGETRTFHKNGKTKSIVNFENNKMEGVSYEYANDSTIIAIAQYKTGILQSYERINQRDENNKKQGIWKEFHPNMEVKKEMKFNDDSLDGYVKEYDVTGNLLKTLKFNNGKRVMRAPEIANVEVYREVYEDGTLKYEGVYSDGLPVGTHYRYKQKYQCDSSLFLKEDTVLKTSYYANRLVCRNVPVPDSAIEYFDGTLVAKGAVDSVRNRQGLWYEFHHTGEFRAKGIYKDNNRTGEWLFLYASGQTEQKGKYDKKGRAQGLWQWYYESGQLMREEHYVNGNREGEIKDYDEEGHVILTGQYVDNKKEGIWKLQLKDYMEVGLYVNDEPDSLWKSYYMPSKTKFFEGAFQSGVPVGVHVAYHPNGQKKYVGGYAGGMRDGDWKFYNEEGYNYLTIFYKNDIEIKWQGEKIYPTYEESLRTYNIKLNDNKTQRVRSK